MRFHLNEDQVAIQDSLRAVLRDHLPSGRLHQLIDGEAEMDAELWRAVMDLGFAGLALPEVLGGSGFDLIEAALAVETLGEAAASGPAVGQMLAAHALAHEGSPHLAGVLTGQTIATLALPEGWLPEHWNLAPLDGQLSGKLSFVIGAESAQLYLVGLQGGHLGLVKAGPHLSVTPTPSIDRTRRSAEITLTEAPVEVLAASATDLFDRALVLTAADCLGGAERVLAMTRNYAMERQQFGQPIAQFQAVKHQLADMAVAVESARALVWYAALALQTADPEASRRASLAKAHLGDVFTSVSRSAVTLHGGIGYTWEHELGIWVRRAIHNSAWLGTATLHRARAATMAGW